MTTTTPAPKRARMKVPPSPPTEPFDPFLCEPVPAPPADPSRAAREWRALSKRLQRMHEPRGVIASVRRTLGAALWPIRAALMALKQTIRFGPLAHRAGGPTCAVQFLRQWRLCVRTQMWPHEYYATRLFLSQRWRIADQFITSEQALMILWAMSPEPERSTLNDKRAFHAAAARLGLPHARAVAVFEDARAVEGASLPLPRADLFVKWTNSFAGQGVHCWRWNETCERYERDGERLSADQLAARLAADSAGGRTLIVQQRVENHPDLHGYSTTAACTARIITARALGGEPHAISAVLRMPTGGSVVDNLSAGGIAAPIDLASGRLSAASGAHAARLPDSIHPDSGEPIVGRTMPHWRDALGLVVRAHRCFPNTGSIGWDVAFTRDGPLLIEANTGWGCGSVQQQCGIPLPATILTPMVKTYLDAWRHTAPAPPWARRAR